MNSIIEKKSELPLEEENKNKLLSLLFKYKYKVPGILLIFNNISTDFNYFYRIEFSENKISIEEIIDKLEKQLSKTTFKEKLKDNSMNMIIKDYYLYFVTRNNHLENRTKDLSNLTKILKKYAI